jgi:hypothetical protein
MLESVKKRGLGLPFNIVTCKSLLYLEQIITKPHHF